MAGVIKYNDILEMIVKLRKCIKGCKRKTAKNACKECDYYISENGTCESKKCSTGNPYVTNFDRKHCKPYHRTSGTH